MIAFLQFLLLKGFSLVINLLPENLSLWAGRALGTAAYYVDANRRAVALQNLRTAFGSERSEQEIRSIAKTTFRNLGMMAMEFFRIPNMDPEQFNARVEIHGLANFVGLRDNCKNGLLLLLSHIGNWELMGLLTKRLGSSRVMVIAKPIKNAWVDRMVTGIREGSGLEVVPSQNAGRRILKALSENRIVGLLIDQRAKRSEGVMADFFGKKAPTTPALAVIGMRTGAPILPLYFLRNGTGSYRLIIQEPLELVQTGDIKADIISNTEKINRSLEEMIRRYPDQWFWVHRRWDRKRSGRHRSGKHSVS
jgi:Kdo2-lipid IVA lauroyltransferase/acyltransferase